MTASCVANLVTASNAIEGSDWTFLTMAVCVKDKTLKQNERNFASLHYSREKEKVHLIFIMTLFAS